MSAGLPRDNFFLIIRATFNYGRSRAPGENNTLNIYFFHALSFGEPAVVREERFVSLHEIPGEFYRVALPPIRYNHFSR